jgi:hypothetical protein
MQILSKEHFVPETLQTPCAILVNGNMYLCPTAKPVAITTAGIANQKLDPLTLEEHFILKGCLPQRRYHHNMVLPNIGNFRFILLAQFDDGVPFVMYSYTLNASTLNCVVTFEFHEAKTFKAFGHTCNQVITLYGFLVNLDHGVIVGQFKYPSFKFRSDSSGKNWRRTNFRSQLGSMVL